MKGADGFHTLTTREGDEKKNVAGKKRTKIGDKKFPGERKKYSDSARSEIERL